MTRFEANLVQLANLLVGGSGLVYAWMRYCSVSSDPFAVVNHPAQPAMMHLHVLSAPLLVFACGLIWRAHVWVRVRSGFSERRKTGLSLAVGLAPMIVSGYALQVSVSETWRDVWIAVHLCTSALWTAAFVLHRWRVWFGGRAPVSNAAAAHERR